MFNAALRAQTIPPPLSTVDVDFQVHYLGPDTVQAKYGRKLPKTIFAGSVTGTNRGGTNVVFGQGFVLQTLRSKGFLALSQQDAKAIVLKSQGTGIRALWGRFSPVAVKILDGSLRAATLVALELLVQVGEVDAGAARAVLDDSLERVRGGGRVVGAIETAFH